jgi:hypothetical protein
MFVASGSFQGSSASTTNLPAGDHIAVVNKSGYKPRETEDEFRMAGVAKQQEVKRQDCES